MAASPESRVAKTSVNCGDLIGREWSVPEADCLAACATLLKRAGMKVAASSLAKCCALGAPQDAWRQLGEGEPIRIGDIVLSEEGDGLHVSAVCDSTRGRAISSSKDHGIYVTRIDKIRAKIGTYRHES